MFRLQIEGTTALPMNTKLTSLKPAKKTTLDAFFKLRFPSGKEFNCSPARATVLQIVLFQQRYLQCCNAIIMCSSRYSAGERRA